MVHMKLKTDNAIADHVRGSFGEDRISVWEGDGYTVVSASVPFAGYSAEECGLGEFDITTDPTEAPADALLEAAGRDVQPGDTVAVAATHSEWGRLVWHKRAGRLVEPVWTMTLADELPIPSMTFTVVNYVGLAKYDDLLSSGGALWPFSVAKATCTQCNGSGRVDGFLGVGIQIPCGECGGEGSV